MTLTATAPTTLAGDLVLLRLLVPGKSGVTPKQLRDDLGKLYRHPPGAEHWEDAVESLVAARLMEVKPYRLTEAGRARALEVLGAERLPARANWGTVRRLLVPRALDIPCEARETRERIGKGDGLQAYLVKEHFGLQAGKTLPQVLEALICKEAGFPEETTLAGLKKAVLRRALGTTEKLSLEDLKKQLPRKVVGARSGGTGELRDAVLRRWIDGSREATPPPAPPVAEAEEKPGDEPPSVEERALDLPAFAATVRAAARACPTGRFGDNKVFISRVWQYLRQEPGFPTMDLREFKERLVEANRAQLLRLSRADLVEVMDPADVAESKTPYLHTEFHFIVVEREQP